MKASQLIRHLQSLVLEHGDLECVQAYDENYMLLQIQDASYLSREEANRITTHGVEDRMGKEVGFICVGYKPK